jgi:hypothetical protein
MKWRCGEACARCSSRTHCVYTGLSMTPEEVRECMSEYDVDNGKLKTLRVPSVSRDEAPMLLYSVVHFAEGVPLFCLYAFVKPALGALSLSSSSSGPGPDALQLLKFPRVSL